MIDLVNERPLKLRRAAALLDVSTATIRRLIERGLECVEIGGMLYTTKEAIQRFARPILINNLIPMRPVDEQQRSEVRPQEGHSVPSGDPATGAGREVSGEQPVQASGHAAAPAEPFTEKGYRYPWHLWADGRVWELKEGTDFRVSAATIRSAAFAHAKRIGKKVKVSIRKGRFLMQFKSKRGRPEKSPTSLAAKSVETVTTEPAPAAEAARP